jgi:hypothetical protein
VKVYIVGPMTGLPGFNFPAFHQAAAALTAAGHEPINPARRGVVPGWEWTDYIRRAICDLATADGIHLLPGWEHSRGAVLEEHIAHELELGRVRL